MKYRDGIASNQLPQVGSQNRGDSKGKATYDCKPARKRSPAVTRTRRGLTKVGNSSEHEDYKIFGGSEDSGDKGDSTGGSGPVNYAVALSRRYRSDYDRRTRTGKYSVGTSVCGSSGKGREHGVASILDGDLRRKHENMGFQAVEGQKERKFGEVGVASHEQI